MRKKIFYFACYFVFALLAYFMGIHVAGRGVEGALNLTQGELAYHHLLKYKEVKDDLEAGCKDSARQRIINAVDQQMLFLAFFIQNDSAPGFKDYIAYRDPELVDVLEEFDVDWNKSWTAPACNSKAISRDVSVGASAGIGVGE